MARVTHTDHVKMTVWTPTLKAEMSGPRMACTIELFRSLDAKQMERALAKMYEMLTARRERDKAVEAAVEAVAGL